MNSDNGAHSVQRANANKKHWLLTAQRAVPKTAVSCQVWWSMSDIASK